MNLINIEIKARCSDAELVRQILKQQGAVFKGVDHQIDTYFHCKRGRLKLREGNIEHHLIHYHRADQAGPKQSNVTLYRPEPNSTLKAILSNALGILVVVDKKREIYFIDNVKFHIDQVDRLGSFIEIEAIDANGEIGADQLRKQCQRYMSLFNIQPGDLIPVSYSDMLLKK